MSTSSSPLLVRERLQLIDALRGLAIFGILMVNMPLMYGPMSNVLLNLSTAESIPDLIAEAIIKVFFEGKFYVLFSALFGFGFYIFLHKPSGTPEDNLRLFRRRLVFLFLFGMAHVSLLWAGDILVFYAAFGFILLAFRNSTERKQLRWAIGFALLPIVLGALLYGVVLMAGMSPESQEATQASLEQGREQTYALYQSAYEAYSSGSYTDTMRIRWQEYLALLPGVLFFYPTVLAMFLLGFIAARRGLISHYQEHIPFWRKALRLGLFIGLPLSMLYAYALHQAPPGDQTSGWYTLATTLHIVGGSLLSLGYVAFMVLRYHGGHRRFMEAYLAPVGRMALSNYISHSLITLLLFHGYGLGLFGKIAIWQGILLTLAIFTMQVFVSRWWLARYRFGPLEWLWRSLTYGLRQPMKVVAK